MISRGFAAGIDYEKINNHELIDEGNKIILEYINKFYENTYPEPVLQTIRQHLTSVDVLAHVAKHIGATDLILTTVHSSFYL